MNRPIPRIYTAGLPLDALTRQLMDLGFRLCPRDNVAVEYARLGKPSRNDPAQEIIIYRTGVIHTGGSKWQQAARALSGLATPASIEPMPDGGSFLAFDLEGRTNA
jgi:hypothetical protein